MRRFKITFKNMFLVSLLLLTFTVIIYDVHVFFNPPKAKVLSVVVMSRGGEAPESWTTEDITNHPLKDRILRYVNMSWLSGRRPFGEYSLGGYVYIVNDPKVEEFFGKYYVSSWCGTCNSAYLKDGDTYYYFMVGYSVVPLSPLERYLERYLATIVSMVTVTLWIFTLYEVFKQRKLWII